ncbi:MAG: metal-dependent hydrolase [Candidatus Hodarchaeota archaeon]
MFTIGHIALGYSLAWLFDRKQKNIPLVFIVSILPDIDFLIPGLQHRGPTHSLFFTLVIFIPSYIIIKRNITPYFIAMLSHSLIGDYVTGKGIHLLWPLYEQRLRYKYSMKLGIQLEAYIECALFIAFLLILFLSGDVKKILKPDKTNIMLLIPLFSVILQMIFEYPNRLPRILTIPNIIFLVIISISIFISMKRITYMSWGHPKSSGGS